MTNMDRREFLAKSSAGLMLPLLATMPKAKGPRRSLRIAHLTDIHVQPERQSAVGFQSALEHAQSLNDKPDLIFFGGDLIMDALGTDKDRVAASWKIFNDVLKANLSVPIEHVLGNHDIFGWNRRSDFEADPQYGKAWAMDVLKLQKPYRFVDKNGWRIIVLDSNYLKDHTGYTARLDDEQFEWLGDVLKNTPEKTPIMVISHIPILGVCPFLDGTNEKSGDWEVPGQWMHIDARRIKDLFRKHANVKLCVSGHIHLVDQVVYNGVNYFCNGAVSPGWWGGDYQECTYGYAVIDLFDDGTFANQYVPYGWKTQP